jgi:hypothetical protein
MMKYHTSYRRQKQNKVNAICAKMRAGKERRRLERDYPEYPPDRPQLCMEIVFKDFECAEPRSVTYTLQACPMRRDSYWAWRDGTRLPTPMGKAQFFRRYLTAQHPRVMPPAACMELF